MYNGNADKTGNTDAIGIFDSGVGGLTVVSEVMKALPNENIIYFGDTARVPYGSKSQETVTKYAVQIMKFLLTKRVKAVIIACNTVSSNSYDELISRFDIPIIEMVQPGARLCLSHKNIKNIGVIATERTISSKAYERAIKQPGKEVNVFSKACPLFVPLAEEGWTNNEVAEMTARLYLRELGELGVEALILGCTHYPLLRECIQKIMTGVMIINPAEAAASEIKRFLSEQNLLNPGNRPKYTFYVSDNTEKFNRICRLVLQKQYDAQIIDIDKY